MEHIKLKKKKWKFQLQEETIKFYMAISLICESVKIAKISSISNTKKETQDNYVNGKVLNLFEQAQT